MQVQEGTEPPEDPRALLDELFGVLAELERLLPRIHRTNLHAALPGGLSLTDALTRRDMLDQQLNILRQAAQAASERQTRYSNSELRMVSLIPARDLQKLLDPLAKERRELETLIQQTNWLTELEG